MTDREQIEKMAQTMCGLCTEDKSCAIRCSTCSEVASQDCSYKESAEELICKGYGKVSEYKAEIERLKDEIIYLERKVAIRDNALKDRDRAIEMLDGKQDTIVNQAKIDVLNELKGRVRTSYVLDDFILGNVVFSKDIDELIKEVQNGEDKS